jgi:hypothetical protein
MTDLTDIFTEHSLDEASSIATDISLLENNDELDEASSIATDISLLENNDELENPANNLDIDELTLSLLMNQTHYRKYVAQNNPEQANLDNQTIHDNRKYRYKILEITANMIDNPDFQISTDIDRSFNAYTRQLIRHFKMKDFDKQNKYHNGWHETNDDDDMLFGNMDGTDNADLSNDQRCTSSLWGKERVIKKGNIPIANHDMRMFSNR